MLLLFMNKNLIFDGTAAAAILLYDLFLPTIMVAASRSCQSDSITVCKTD